MIAVALVHLIDARPRSREVSHGGAVLSTPRGRQIRSDSEDADLCACQCAFAGIAGVSRMCRFM
jgi:hypothetical protein